MNEKLIKRIIIPSYIQFVICIAFWVCSGIGLIKTQKTLIFLMLVVLTFCCISIILTVIVIDRFYVMNIQENLENLEKLNLKLRTQRHEYLNEMQIVYGLLEIQEYEEAVKYLRPMYEDIAKVGKALKTARPAVNALLYSKSELAKSKNITMFIEISSDLAEIKLLQWDLCKILANIIDNAITVLEEDDNTKDKKIHVQISENSGEYIILIYNNGPVIPKEKLPQIFKRGYTSKKEEGHGLGLGIVKDIVDANGGVIEVSSRPEKTSFSVCIPK